MVDVMVGESIKAIKEREMSSVQISFKALTK